MLNPDKEWEKFGRRAPYYWGGINKEQFRDHTLGEESLEELFASGRDHIDYVLSTIRERIRPDFAPSRALDFGCGVGRLAFPLAAVCPEVVGLDVSEPTLEEARNVSRRLSLTNVTFHKSDDELSQVSGSFDLIHSTFTIQHIPTKRGEKIVRKLASMLSDNGVGALDFLIHRDVSKALQTMGSLRKRVPYLNNFANLLEGKSFVEPLAEKNVYDLNRIMTILQDSGCGNFHVMLFRNGNHRDAMVFFQKRRDKALPHEAFYNKVVALLALVPALEGNVAAALVDSVQRIA